jgi:hypothetical protein
MVNCTECSISPVSARTYTCGGVGCAGTYGAANLFSLKAPTGYVWTGAPDGCTGRLPYPPYEWIQCAGTTEVAVVPPNL